LNNVQYASLCVFTAINCLQNQNILRIFWRSEKKSTNTYNVNLFNKQFLWY
jgi:hypothetical protein